MKRGQGVKDGIIQKVVNIDGNIFHFLLTIFMREQTDN